MASEVKIRVVFGCPACLKRSEWPKTPFGELVGAFKCSHCGAEGLHKDSDLVEKLLDVMESDELARQNAAQREKVLESLSE